MGLVRTIRRFAYRAKETTGLAFFLRTRRLQVHYDVKIANHGADHAHFTLVVPIPVNSESQLLLGKPMFRPDPSAIRTDEIFGNHYAVWQGDVRPGEVASYQESYLIRVKPFRPRLVRQHIDGYRNLNAETIRKYLAPNRYLQSEDESVIRLARELRGKETNVVKILKALNSHVIHRLAYGDPIPGLYSSHDALTRDVVDCGGFDTLLAALAMSLGIPSRIVSGFWAVSRKKNDMHAWLEFMLPDGTWVPADPSVEKLVREGRAKKSGKFGFVGSDRIALSVGCDIPVQWGEMTERVDILQHPFVWSGQGTANLLTETTFSIRKVWRD